jgi:radical SAM protein with 4Fe4S-binding SPASM domain
MRRNNNTFYKSVNKRIVQFQEKFVRNSRVFGHPFHLVLESGNVCNLKCPLCPTPFREDTTPKGMLSFENAKRILDQFPALIHLNLSLWGEPFLNKDIFKIIKYAKSKSIEVLVQSNLNIFNETMAENLINSRLDILQISLDGASQESYEKYRVSGDFARVIKNIEMIRGLQEKLNNRGTRIIWKMVVNKFNEHEKQLAKSWAEKLGVEFMVVEIYTPRHLTEEWKPREKLSDSYHVHTDIMESCYSLWQVATVNFNGDVIPCCSEFSRKDAIGNLFEEPFSKIWNNNKYRDLRKQNKKNLNCSACHVDKVTNWYKLWMRPQDT